MPELIRCPACGAETNEVGVCPQCRTVAPSTGGDPRTPHADSNPAPPATASLADDAPAGEAAPDLPAAVGRFRVLGWVGEGSFAEVYRAYDPHLDREVALKVARPGTLGTPRRVARFLREARAAANLRHPNIVPLYETGEDAGRHYLVAAFVRGQTLGARAAAAEAAGGLDPAQAARFVRRLAEALAYAHTRGIVHRDVKPENVMIDEGDEPLLLDFGLAARTDEGGERLTRAGVAVGTPAYIAPEQADADASRVGPASDQYALGCVLYELLTGQTPFAGPPEIQILLHRTEPPPPPRRVRRAVPRDLETICLKCLEKDPAHRYPDCQALADDLRRWQDGEPIAARRIGPLQRLARWARREPGWAALAVAGVLVAVGAVVARYEVRRAAEARDREVQREAEATLRRQKAEGLVVEVVRADTAKLPEVLAELRPFRTDVAPALRARTDTAPDPRARLNLLLARMPDEPALAAEVAERLLTAESAAVPVLVAALAAAGAENCNLPALWAAAQGDSVPAVRAAVALAVLAPNDDRWADLSRRIAGRPDQLDRGALAVVADVGQPLRGRLAGVLAATYRDLQNDLDRHNFPDDFPEKERTPLTPAQVAERINRQGVIHELLSGFAATPEERAELFLTAARQHARLLLRRPLEPEAAAVVFRRALAEPPRKDGRPDAAVRRKARAAVGLLLVGRPDDAWPVFRLAPDPATRAYLIDEVAALAVDPKVLADRYAVETDDPARRALVLALGEYDVNALPNRAREVAGRFLTDFRDDPDPGLHAALDWTLRRWGRKDEVAKATAALPRAERRGERRWFVNDLGLTFAVVPKPGRVRIGSENEEGLKLKDIDIPYEKPVEVAIDHTFAIGLTEVTWREFEDVAGRGGPPWRFPDRPVAWNWRRAALFCNKLSEREKFPPEEWCYDIPKSWDGELPVTVKKNHTRLRGYRLPTEAEWEFACRAGTATPRFFGRSVELIGRYAHHLNPHDNSLKPPALLKPNDLGLFDVYGNAFEWVFDVLQVRPSPPLGGEGEVTDGAYRALRGGDVLSSPLYQLRSAYRNGFIPSQSGESFGFRVARTLP